MNRTHSRALSQSVVASQFDAGLYIGSDIIGWGDRCHDGGVGGFCCQADEVVPYLKVLGVAMI